GGGWIGAAEFGAGFVGCEHPFDAGSGFIPPLLPCCDLVSEPFGVVDAAVEALASTLISHSTILSQLACFGVKWNSRRRRMRRASAGANASYSAPGLWIDRLSCTTRMQAASG